MSGDYCNPLFPLLWEGMTVPRLEKWGGIQLGTGRSHKLGKITVQLCLTGLRKEMANCSPDSHSDVSSMGQG